MNLIQWWQKYIKQCTLREGTYYWSCWSYKGVACPPYMVHLNLLGLSFVLLWSPWLTHDPLSYFVHRWCLLMFWYFTLRSVTELSPSAWSLHDLCWCSMWYLTAPSPWLGFPCYTFHMVTLHQHDRESIGFWVLPQHDRGLFLGWTVGSSTV